MAETALVTVPAAALEPRDLNELQRLGALLAASGYFRDARDVAQASVKVLAGREMGFPPIASMVGIAIIEGKPAVGSNLVGAALKRAGYTWKVLQLDTQGCRLQFSHNREVLGVSEFLRSDAERANLLGKQNWKMYPKPMYFSRAITAGARIFAPEVYSGIVPYTAEELGAEHTTEDGALVVDVAPEQRPPDGGSHEAQVEVLEKRLTEETAKANGGQQQAPPPPAAFPRTIKAPEVHPGNVPDEVERLWRRIKGGKEGLPSVLQVCGEMKADIIETTGSEAGYYEVLGKHGLKHANELKGTQAARQLVRDLYEYLVKARAALEPPPEPYQATDDDLPPELGGVS